MHDFFDDCRECSDNKKEQSGFCSNCGAAKTWQAQGGGAELLKCPNCSED